MTKNPEPRRGLHMIHRFERGEELHGFHRMGATLVILTSVGIYTLEEARARVEITPGPLIFSAPPGPYTWSPDKPAPQVPTPPAPKPKKTKTSAEIVAEAHGQLTSKGIEATPAAKPARKARADRPKLTGWAEKVLRHRPRGMTAEQVLGAIVAAGGPLAELEDVQRELNSLVRTRMLICTAGRYRIDRKRVR